MSRTWGDMKNEALQLMFGYTLNGTNMRLAQDNMDYIAAMPQAANAALRDLASTAAPLVRTISISVSPVPNMLGDGISMFAPTQSVGTEHTYVAINPKAFYCEVDNPCEAHLELLNPDGTVIGEPLAVHLFEHKRSFQPWAGPILSSGTIRLRFLPGKAYSIRNVAFYTVPFDSAEDVPPFTRYDRYDLRKLTAGQPGYEFMELAPNNVVLISPTGYARSDDFRWEGDSVFVVDHYLTGQYDIYYHAYPAPIREPNIDEVTKEVLDPGTLDSYKPELCDEALDLVPLYIAARLYADENPPLASSYMNRYMARRSELSSRETPLGTGEFVSESGWI